ncbi:prenyltransferase [Streptomyces sp. 4N509B]|uniref:prenyltransferase n=1 Tax=Streptomyces sp. 4N509B TaxID=3457413 RepID=UPI003FD49814
MITEVASAQRPTTGRKARNLSGAFARLGKVALFEIWLGPLVAWSLISAEAGAHPRSWLLCLLFFLVLVFGMSASHAFDDVAGYRDGSDLRNYAPERRRSQVKPLVLGQLTVRSALAFAYVCTAVAIGFVVLFSLVAEFEPWWILPAGVTSVVLGVQYSVGISFSYRVVGGGEAVTGLTLASSVLLPYVAATQRVDAAAVIQAVLFGAWLVQVMICSNSADAEDDRQVGRRTVAARTSPRANRAFVATVFCSVWLLTVLGALTGALGAWVVPALLPAWTLQAYVLRNGWRGRWRNRRNYGFQALRLGVLGLVVANVLA